VRFLTSALKVFPAPAKWLSRLKALTKRLWMIDLDEFLCGHNYATCFDRECLLWSTSRELVEARIIYEGSWIGLFHGKRLLPSTALVEKIFEKNYLRAAIVVSSKASELFLYGRDVFESSIVMKYGPVDSIVAVLEPEEKSVIGFASYDASCRCFRNLYDLGIFLRLLG